MRFHHSIALTLAGLLASAAANATQVVVVGVFPNKAAVQIDGGTPRTLSVGQKTPEGVTLLSVERNAATFDIAGKQARLAMGQAHSAGPGPTAPAVVLNADSRGHFFTDAQVNGRPIRFVVDTGATLIAIPAAQAQRLSLDYRKGDRVTLNTANGPVPGYRISLDTVRMGEVTVNGVDAVVLEGAPLPVSLLGMSFLNRMEMKRVGQTMTLIKRY